MDSIITFIEQYLNVPFLLAVLFGVESVNKYVPQAKKVKNQTVTLLVSSVLAIIFFFLQQPENLPDWRINMFISWLASIGAYDFVVKPIKDKFNKEENIH
jgi:hypothetical protein